MIFLNEAFSIINPVQACLDVIIEPLLYILSIYPKPDSNRDLSMSHKVNFELPLDHHGLINWHWENWTTEKRKRKRQKMDKAIRKRKIGETSRWTNRNVRRCISSSKWVFGMLCLGQIIFFSIFFCFLCYCFQPQVGFISLIQCIFMNYPALVA